MSWMRNLFQKGGKRSSKHFCFICFVGVGALDCDQHLLGCGNIIQLVLVLFLPSEAMENGGLGEGRYIALF
jgi:hypothetical protein